VDVTASSAHVRQIRLCVKPECSWQHDPNGGSSTATLSLAETWSFDAPELQPA
jgi:hypothetical protein